MEEATFTISHQGHTKLIHGGYEYIKNREFYSGTHWRCSKHRKGGCKGKAQVRKISSNEYQWQLQKLF